LLRHGRIALRSAGLLAFATTAFVLASACNDDDAAQEPATSLDSLCMWLQDVSSSSLTDEVTEENVLEIGVDAGELANAAGRLQLPSGEIVFRLENTVEVLVFIEDEAQREAAVDTIPVYRQALVERLDLLLDATRVAYDIPPDEAPCADFDVPE
jgi:hypothetical protein